MNKYKKVAANTAIFFIGNFGSKILSFLLVRFYTEKLSPEEYGTVDIITSTLGFVVPIITLCITEAVLRFAIDKTEDKRKIMTTGVGVVLLGNLLFLSTIPLFWGIDVFKAHLLEFYLLVLTNSLYQVLSHFARGCGNTKVFAISGILHTFMQISMNILLLLVFTLGIAGYLFAVIIANIVSIIFVFVAAKLYRHLSFKIDISYIKRMLIYSLPLIPNSISWWIMLSSDRYVIMYMLGVAENGFYTVANKIPTIITSFSSIFFSAWQLSSVEESDSEDKSNFYSNVLQMTSLCLLLLISFVLIIIEPLFGVWVEASYYQAWTCAPLLILSSFFSCLSSFLGTNYVAMKKTTGVFLTTVVGAVTNLALNILLTPIIGIRGTALSTVVAFVITWLIRAIDTRKFVSIKYSIRTFFIPLLIVIAQTTLLTIEIDSYIPQIICFTLILILCSDYILKMAKMLILLLKKRQKKTKP